MNNTDDGITINQNCLAAPEFTKSCAHGNKRYYSSQKKGYLCETKKKAGPQISGTLSQVRWSIELTSASREIHIQAVQSILHKNNNSFDGSSQAGKLKFIFLLASVVYDTPEVFQISECSYYSMVLRVQKRKGMNKDKRDILHLISTNLRITDMGLPKICGKCCWNCL